ncbi:MAG: hypothetical protein RLZZ618_1710 [Pseudomonadota bacterium]|jgi:competence protein ComEA
MIKKLLCALALFVAHSAFAAVDVNKADQATLETVKGIGPSMSTRILDERKKNAFKDWPDLVDRVKGVGEGSAARYSKEGLTVNGASFTPSEQVAKTDKKPFGKAPAATEAKK